MRLSITKNDRRPYALAHTLSSIQSAIDQQKHKYNMNMIRANLYTDTRTHTYCQSTDRTDYTWFTLCGLCQIEWQTRRTWIRKQNNNNIGRKKCVEFNWKINFFTIISLLSTQFFALANERMAGKGQKEWNMENQFDSVAIETFHRVIFLVRLFILLILGT